MYESVTVNRTLPLPVDRVWAAISGIGGLERWFPVIAACRVTGSGVGAKRFLTLAAGGEITDKIEMIDHERRCFRYNRIESPFPVSRYIGTVDVTAVGDGGTIVDWTVEIEVAGAEAKDLAAFLRQALTDGVVGLERDLLADSALEAS